MATKPQYGLPLQAGNTVATKASHDAEMNRVIGVVWDAAVVAHLGTPEAEALVDEVTQISAAIADDRASAALSAAQAALYDGPRTSAVGSLIADTAITYGAGPGHVDPGDRVRTDDGAHSYQVAVSGESNAHLITAGGVKLYVMPGPDGEYAPEAFGAVAGQAGNIPAFEKYLSVRAPYAPTVPIERSTPQPKLQAVSQLALKSFQGFPSAVRHNGADYILYREGDAHVENLPIGTKARLVCAVRPVDALAPSSRTTIFAQNNVDPRDPNVLRDDVGNAILVGGKFKIVTFEWLGSYAAGNARAVAYDLDPADLASGLTNPVAIPGIDAVKSDVRLLSTGLYAFVGYTVNGRCHLVTTHDWVTFSTQFIGAGNEAAFCETWDGQLNVIARAEERFGHRATIFYKRLLSGGNWWVQEVLPYTLNAPTLVKAADIRVISTYPGGNEGWLLFGRDKTGRTALINATEATAELVCLRSKEDFGRKITRFIDRTVIMGTPISGIAPVGDNHYCSVIAAKYSGALDIYTYAELRSAMDGTPGSFGTAVLRVEGHIDADQAIRIVGRNCRNFVMNGDLAQGEAWIDLANANADLVTDASGLQVVQVTDVLGASPSRPTFYLRGVKRGMLLFPKLRMRTSGRLPIGAGRHITVGIYDYSSGSPVLLQTETPNLNELDHFGAAKTVLLRPVVATSDKMMIIIGTVADVTNAVTDILHIEMSDDYSRDINPPPPCAPAVARSALSMTVTSGGTTATGTYTSNIWGALGLLRRGDGLPFPAVSAGDITLLLENCTTNSGALRVICTSVVVANNGAVTATVAVAPGASGTFGATVAFDATAIIRTP